MATPTSAPVARRARLALPAIVGLLLLFPPSGQAAVLTFGSPLAVPATKDTAHDLAYRGSDIALPGSIFHIPHDGADTALWNVAQTAPASGQIVSVRLEGCASQPPGAPAPLTEIHFQDLVPQPGGGIKANVTTQAFNLPVCGQGGAGPSTVTSFAPTNFCVSQGDYVDFNDEGGFVPSASGPPPYPSGVPYLVIGASPGATMSSFIRNNGVGNGAIFSPTDTSYHDGFVSNRDSEVLLQATLATAQDATSLCPGGTRRAAGGGGSQRTLPPIRVSPQTVGVNRSRVASVAVYCRPTAGCRGVATLAVLGTAARVGRGRSAEVLGSSSFYLRGSKTGHVPIRVSARLIGMLRKQRRGVPVSLTVAAAGATVTQTITLRIF